MVLLTAYMTKLANMFVCVWRMRSWHSSCYIDCRKL